ncbi:Maltose/maltodextrin transport system permease protein MalG [Paenibacillus plantiphilus]|uniref:Maltose/maltodextrin transport system permease protein MalG n=1 Tax=Paenibacillus plantiphilus TaxID=2905650 RepID=A0ABN8G0F7_9BACL|nr:sugar ABC transporter permease [Paenibacillus plantiphilus]CAH1196064.1 Maltose/maltodextrin transport system permease protein MalG [Paenibacillus plantiphilus]
MKAKTRLRLLLSYIVLIILAICVLYPALWTIMSSFKEGKSLFTDSIIPKKLTLDHYRDLFSLNSRTDIDIPYFKWYWNTLVVATWSMIIGTFIQLLTAYAFSRFRFNGRKSLLSTVLVLGMFPGFMSLIAIYLILIQMNMLDTHMALILVYSAGAALGLFVAKGFFDTIPRSLEEAARIDGADHLTIFFRIILPLSRPIITYISLMTFTGAWVDFIFAGLILRSRDKWTIAVGLYDLVNAYNSTEFTLFAAGAVLVAIPITILFSYTQRFLVAGLTAGSSKG